MPRHVTLAGQLLALQLLIVLGVLVGVAAMSIAQSAGRPAGREPARAEQPPRTLAANPLVRERLPVADPRATTPSRPRPRPRGRCPAPGPCCWSSSTARWSPRRPRPGRPPVPLGPPRWPGAGRGPAWWTPVPAPSCPPRCRCSTGAGPHRRCRRRRAAATPRCWSGWRDAVPNLLTYLGVASALGVVGSLLLARRVKRQTLGHGAARRSPGWSSTARRWCTASRRAWSPSTRDERVTLVNDSAAGCWPARRLRRPHAWPSSTLEGRCATSLTGRRREPDRAVALRRDRVLASTAADALPRPRDRLGHHPARPHRAARAAARARHRAARHRHAARADARVRQPAAHDLRPDPARRVRRGGALRRRGQPQPGRRWTRR